MKRRILSAALVLVMTSGFLPVSVWAQSPSSPLLLDDPNWTVADSVEEAFYEELAALCAEGCGSDASETQVAPIINSVAPHVAANTDGDYQTARVLALTEGKLNTELLGARRALYDGTGMWVLQFETPAEAKAAVDTLSQAGIDAEPDRLHTLAEPQTSYLTAQAVTKPSDGCDFSAFKTLYADVLAQTSGTVAIVDTGVYCEHEIFDGITVLDGYDVASGSSRTAVNDLIGHGTHVAGIVADIVRGLDVQILPIRISNDKWGYASDSIISAGIKKAADMGADVLNLSFGSGVSCCSAAEYALDKGCMILAASGNDRDYMPDAIEDNGIQCMTENGKNNGRSTGKYGVVVVGACSYGDTVAYWSNYGPTLDLVAPGVDVYSSTSDSKTSYEFWDGTSMATPHAAAAALLVDMLYGKKLTPAELEKALLTATSNGGKTRISDRYGYGALHMAKLEPPDELIWITFDANGGTVSPSGAWVNAEGKLGELPTPERAGYTFDGWYTEPVDGEKVDVDRTYDDDTTLYAHWTEIPTDFGTWTFISANWYGAITDRVNYKIAVFTPSAGFTHNGVTLSGYEAFRRVDREGTVQYLAIVAASETAETLNAKLTGAASANKELSSSYQAAGRGDLNKDGVVDDSDTIHTIYYIWGVTMDAPLTDAWLILSADIDFSGTFDLDDVIAVADLAAEGL